jgi:hypothetical protein
MDLLFGAQGFILLFLGVAALAMQAWAVVHAATTRPEAFVAAGKRTKGFWLAVTGVAALLGVVTLGDSLNLFGLLAFVAAGVYLTDVRPAVQAMRGRNGGGSNMGPYGPW